MSGRRKKKRKRGLRIRNTPGLVVPKIRDSGTPTGELHFTVGTGPSFDPSTKHLSLENDVSLLKVGLLYADRVRLCSIGSSLALKMLTEADFDPERQLDFLERHFQDNVSRDDPEAATKVLEFVRLYRPLRRGRNLTKEQLALRLKIAREIGAAWSDFKVGWQDFARTAGVEDILAARRSGLVDIDSFEAGGVERGTAFSPEASELRSEEFYEEITAELFGMLSSAVSGGTTHPMFDNAAGELVRLGVQAGAISVSETGRGKGRHAGLASHLLRRLPLFDQASVDEILGIRRELERPLIKFRGALIEFSEGVRTSGWDPDFTGDAEDVFMKKVAPAVREIEEAVRDNRFLAELLPRMIRPQDWTAGASFGMAAFNLASLPEIASLAVGGGVGFAAAARNVYLKHQAGQREIEGKRLFFYREAGRRLAGT